MFAISTLPWTWLIVKSKCNGLGGLPSPSVLGLTCFSDPRYFGFDMFSKLILPHSLGRVKGEWSLPLTLLTAKSKRLESVMFVKPTLLWTWLNVKSKYLVFRMSMEDGHSLRRVKRGWLLPKACQRRMVVTLNLTNCQAETLWVWYVCQIDVTLNLA